MGEEIDKLFVDSLEEVTIPPEEKKAKKIEASSEVLEGLVDQGKIEQVVLEKEQDREQQKEAIDKQLEFLEGAITANEVSTKTTEAPKESMEPLRVLEAALFLANKPLGYKQLQDILQVPSARLEELLSQLQAVIPQESAIELHRTEHAACFQLKPKYLERISHLSKEVELSRKAMRILALVAKKKEMLQADFKHFFKGEIYAYVTELKNAGYLESKKHGNTRLLRPTTKFYESFQFKE